jgi:CheY-like chemotaxis protein
MSEKATILIVDDQEFNRDILMEYLEGAGYEILVAENGQQALASLREHPEVDLVVLDRMMPDMDGLAVLKEIKRVVKRRDVPVILQTAAAAPHQVREGIEAGAFYYLTKPYERETLLAIVQTARNDLEQHRAIRHELTEQRRTLALMDEGRFRFRTLEEAQSLAYLVAGFCPEPERVIGGLSELMVNAVEHGNLGITYDDKSALLRTGEWRLEVERRLALPENLDRFAVLEFQARARDFVIVIRDQGPGFAWREFLELSPSRATDRHGRGVAMARALSFATLEYRGPGNEAVCVVSRSGPTLSNQPVFRDAH